MDKIKKALSGKKTNLVGIGLVLAGIAIAAGLISPSGDDLEALKVTAIGLLGLAGRAAIKKIEG